MIRIKLLLALVCIGIAGSSTAKLTKEDYNRADSISQFSDLVYNWQVNPNWIEGTEYFWYSVKNIKGTEYKMVNAVKGTIKPAFDQEKLVDKLNEVIKNDKKPYELPIRNLEFEKDRNTISFEMAQKKWKYNIKKNKLIKTGEIEKPKEWSYWGETSEEQGGAPIDSPDEMWTAFIRNNNLFIKNKESKKEIQLSFDGSSADYYSCYMKWSPDSKYIAVNRIRKHEKQYFYMVESSPEEQLQPILQKREYLKAGDVLPIKRPCLFSVADTVQIPVDNSPYENQFDLSNLKWKPDSKSFTFEFNQRGHQVYQVVEVLAENGKTNVIIDERFDTFFDYSGKKYRFDVEGENEIIWASERDGWNHLYLFDAKTGQIKNQITSGNWVVRGVEKVDTVNRVIYFKAAGMYTNEDPYFVHYCKVNFDGSGMTDLTPEKQNHSATFSHDYTYFVDTYSTVNDAPVSVLRSAADGKVLLKLEQADITDLLEAGWKQPEVFVAKGRDGTSDIWGNIYYPTNFDSTKTYPVIEYIYAGPHAAFTQKSFRPVMHSFSRLAELGFIIVQMDGMGTSYRSKAFHDVCNKNLKDAGFPDRILWMKDAAKTRPYMDLSRVGIFGASAGGQSSMGALLFHPEFYKVAVSSCGCHDNRMDKIWWNEQWMGYPVGKHYEECSNVVNAHKLEGNLMLIVGELDDNVDPSSTMQVADALIKADKDFELVVLPGVNHTLGGEYGERKRRDFFVRHLLNEATPHWNN